MKTHQFLPSSSRNSVAVQSVDASGTLMHAESQPGQKEYYSMALLAQATEKGIACYVYTARPDGVCVMENCHLL